MDDRLERIRRTEEHSHTETYNTFLLFRPGSWLAKPVHTVLELLSLFDGYHDFCALDLGCGVGRNCIPVAQHFRHIPCRVDCVDILEIAISKLQENARQYGVADRLSGIVSPIEDFIISPDGYDLILAVSALEHIGTEKLFRQKLLDIRNGLRPGGAACLIVNTDITERDKTGGKERAPQFEINLPAETFRLHAEQIFDGWTVIKHSVVHQKYDIPREGGLAVLETDVVTYAVQRPL